VSPWSKVALRFVHAFSLIFFSFKLLFKNIIKAPV
jgi:hypothetical protein